MNYQNNDDNNSLMNKWKIMKYESRADFWPTINDKNNDLNAIKELTYADVDQRAAESAVSNSESFNF